LATPAAGRHLVDRAAGRNLRRQGAEEVAMGARRLETATTPIIPRFLMSKLPRILAHDHCLIGATDYVDTVD
jgi:hypothetical protein